MEEADDEVWVTRQGEKIPICRMTERHVRNALGYVLRTSDDVPDRLRLRIGSAKTLQGLTADEARDALREFIQAKNLELELASWCAGSEF